MRGNIFEVLKLPFCVITAFSHLTQSIYSLSYSSHSPEVWSSLKHPHLTEMAQLYFHFQYSLWCFVPVSAATQHQNQPLQSYCLYYCYLFWLRLPNYTHRQWNLSLDSPFPGNLIHAVGWLSCCSSGLLRFVP